MDNYMNDDGDTDIAHHDHVFGELAERREKKQTDHCEEKISVEGKTKKNMRDFMQVIGL